MLHKKIPGVTCNQIVPFFCIDSTYNLANLPNVVDNLETTSIVCGPSPNYITIAEDYSDMLSGTDRLLVSMDEANVDTDDNPGYWMGCNTDGTLGASTDTCGTWDTPATTGSIGDVTATDSTFLSSGTLQDCTSQAHHFICGCAL